MIIPSFELDPDGEHVWWYHRCAPVDKPDEGWIGDILNTKDWKIVQREPLTVEPSVHCLRCGTHGFITHGEWQSV